MREGSKTFASLLHWSLTTHRRKLAGNGIIAMLRRLTHTELYSLVENKDESETPCACMFDLSSTRVNKKVGKWTSRVAFT